MVFSFNRVVDRKLSSPGVWIFSAVHQDENGYSFKALNDSVFVVELERPFPAFLGIVSMLYTAVVPREAVEFTVMTSVVIRWEQDLSNLNIGKKECVAF